MERTDTPTVPRAENMVEPQRFLGSFSKINGRGETVCAIPTQFSDVCVKAPKKNRNNMRDRTLNRQHGIRSAVILSVSLAKCVYVKTADGYVKRGTSKALRERAMQTK